jgi:hypothetical protein
VKISRYEAEQILIALTGGQRPRKGRVLAFTDEGFRWVTLAELEDIQIPTGEQDEQV